MSISITFHFQGGVEEKNPLEQNNYSHTLPNYFECISETALEKPKDEYRFRAELRAIHMGKV